MPSLKRASHQLVHLRETFVPDPQEFFRGHLKATVVSEPVACSLLAGTEVPVSQDELRVLSSVPASRWVAVAATAEALGVEEDVLEGLIEKGLLVSDQLGAADAAVREKNDKLASQEWFPFAAVYHFMSKWRDAHKREEFPSDLVGFGRQIQEQLQKHCTSKGAAPSHFHEIANAEARFDLPPVERNDTLFSLLTSRKTNRLFDAEKVLSGEDLSTLLYYVYGCHGLTRFSGELSWIKKTSPSGGSMHPIEIYPLILRAEGLDPGIYHYNIERHALERMKRLTLEEAEDWANEFCSGQTFVRSAQVLFIMTARFRRCFWKYPNHAKAYRVILMDAGHLSQTLYLVCTQLNLGAFFTAAISEHNIEEKLGLDEIEEGAIGISACGHVDRNPPYPPFKHEPYRPPR